MSPHSDTYSGAAPRASLSVSLFIVLTLACEVDTLIASTWPVRKPRLGGQVCGPQPWLHAASRRPPGVWTSAPPGGEGRRLGRAGAWVQLSRSAHFSLGFPTKSSESRTLRRSPGSWQARPAFFSALLSPFLLLFTALPSDPPLSLQASDTPPGLSCSRGPFGLCVGVLGAVTFLVRVPRLLAGPWPGS